MFYNKINNNKHYFLQVSLKSCVGFHKRKLLTTIIWLAVPYCNCDQHFSMGLHHPLDGDAKLKYKLLCFLTPNKNKFQIERHYLFTGIDVAI